MGGEASASNAAFHRGTKAFRAYQFRKSIRALRQSLVAVPLLSRSQRVRVHVMLAVSYYNQANTAQARMQFLAALKLAPSTPVPSGQSPPATAFFRAVKSSYVAPKPVPKPREIELFPTNREKPVVRSTVLVMRRRPVVRRVFNKTPPVSRPSFFWNRHYVSLFVGVGGVVLLGVGIGLGAAFEGQKAAYKAKLNQPQQTGEQIWRTYQEVDAMAGPANAFLVSGAVVSLAAVGVFVAEIATQKKPKVQHKRGGRGGTP